MASSICHFGDSSVTCFTTNAEALAYRIVQSMSLQWKRKRIGSEAIRRGVKVWALLKAD